jgi:hypothetical protein
MRACVAWAYLKSSAQQNMGSLNVKEPLPVDRKRRVNSVLGFGRVQRSPEIDAQEGRSFTPPPRFAYQVSAVICIFFIGVRHNWFGNHLTQQTLGLQLDKWQLGPLRLVNLIAFACVIYWSRKLLTRLFLIEPFIMLGKASLQVFCAHLAFVFVGLALLYGTVSQLHGFHAVGLVALTFVGLIFVALRKTRRERQEQTTNNPELKINPSPTYV